MTTGSSTNRRKAAELGTTGFVNKETVKSTTQRLLVQDMTSGGVVLEENLGVEVTMAVAYGQFLFCGCQNGYVFAIDPNTKKFQASIGVPHTGEVTAILTFENQIVTCGKDGLVKMWTTQDDAIHFVANMSIEQQEAGAFCTSLVWIASKGHIIGGCNTGILSQWQFNPSDPNQPRFIGNMAVFDATGVFSLLLETQTNRILCVSQKGDMMVLDANSPTQQMTKSADARQRCSVSTASLVYRASNSQFYIIIGDNQGNINMFNLDTLKFYCKILNISHKSTITSTLDVQGLTGKSGFITVCEDGVMCVWFQKD